MSEQELFQERPKETAACTLVKDTVDSLKVREFIKERITQKLNPTAENFIIEENDFQWSITQKFVEQPAMINLRLKSYRKGMKLVAFNSFEVYHGGCKVTFMRIRNDLSDDKLKTHVDDAIKAYKEQAIFGEKEAIDFKKNHKKLIKLEKKANEKLEKEFENMVFERNKDGLVKVFNRHRSYGNNYDDRNGKYVQLLEIAKCNKFDFAPKSVDLPKDENDKLPETVNGKVYTVMVADYNIATGAWFYDILNLSVEQSVKMFNQTKKGTKITKLPTEDKGKKVVDIYMPCFAVGTSKLRRYCDTYNRSCQSVKHVSTFSHCASTPQFVALVKQLNLKVWKIYQD